MIIVNNYKKPLFRLKAMIDRYPLYEKYIRPIRMAIRDIKRRKHITSEINHIILLKPFPLFKLLEIETINRCNNTCSFCPANRDYDTRPFKLMDYTLFLSIINQLKNLKFSGHISLYSNNEPLLDNRIVDLCKVAKENLAGAYLSIWTNGILLTIDKFRALMDVIDDLVIDNYSDDLKLIGPVKEVYNYCSQNKIYQNKKVEIRLRKLTEYLTTRGGQAKNRSRIRPLKSPCILPFTQFVIRPDGKVSLCCNDALGMMTMGDLTKDKIIDIWNNQAYQDVRARLLKGRAYVSLCSSCDASL